MRTPRAIPTLPSVPASSSPSHPGPGGWGLLYVNPSRKFIMARKAARKPEGPQFRVVDLSELKPDTANARIHDERSISGIQASLEQFGPARSLVVDGQMIVRAGNGTMQSLERAGFNDVLVVRPAPGQVVAVQRDDWGPTQATAYGIADNRLTDLSGFDQEAEARILAGLRDEGFDLDALGYTDSEADKIIRAAAGEGKRPPDTGQKNLGDIYMIVIKCENESQQVELLKRFQGEGLNCNAHVG
jgi:hypothetical protein